MSHMRGSEDQTINGRKGIFKNTARLRPQNVCRPINELTKTTVLGKSKSERNENPSKIHTPIRKHNLITSLNLQRSELSTSSLKPSIGEEHVKRPSTDSLFNLHAPQIEHFRTVKSATVEDFIETFSSDSNDEELIIETKIGDAKSTVDFGGNQSYLSDALLESEMNIYKKHLQKYDQQAKSLIKKFTSSLDEKGKIIKKYEDELSKANNIAGDLQRELEELLKRSKELEPSLVSNFSSNDLRSENEILKQKVKELEIKLNQRDLHIFNLKQVLSLETNKIKQLNNAQEEVIMLQNESTAKTNEINALRDELNNEQNLKSELVVGYEEKISKMKKLLAVRDIMLVKNAK